MNHRQVKSGFKKRARAINQKLEMLRDEIDVLLTNVSDVEDEFTDRDYDQGRDEWYNSVCDNLALAEESLCDAINEICEIYTR